MARSKGSKQISIERRQFLKRGALAGAAALAAPTGLTGAVLAQAAAPQTAPRSPTTPIMSAAAETATPPEVEVLTTDRSGSDFMVDVFKAMGFDYVFSNPGSSFRGLHESVINYGGNERPEFITCCHEESSVAMAHGYYKADGKPPLVMAHGTVGLQHASMAIYNAYCDRVPIYMVIGNYGDATLRRPLEWTHSVQDPAAMVRDYTKWDDTPWSLQHFAESAVRAYKIALTPPMGPVVLAVDAQMQEAPLAPDVRPQIPRLTVPVPPQGDSGAVAEAARLLVAAENPLLVADLVARTPAGMTRLIELAEALQAGVIDLGGRMNFPSRHPLNQTSRTGAATSDADVILGLDVLDFWSSANALRDQLTRTSRSTTKPGVKMISITSGDLFIKANYQDFRRLQPVDLAIAADAEATLPSLIEAVKRLTTPDRTRAFESRGAKLTAASNAAYEASRAAAANAWDATPISTARLCAEIWAQIRHEDWALVSSYFADGGGWPKQLWDFNKPYHWLGGGGGGGIGYGAPASVGAALANKKHGRLSVCIQADGDLMYAPGILWTAAHHRIPILSVMHNNRAYHQEVMHVQRMCNRHNRGIDRGGIGSTLTDPNVDYAKVAQGMGVYAEGPITNPADLGPALKRAIAIVKRGEPALVDVVAQGR